MDEGWQVRAWLYVDFLLSFRRCLSSTDVTGNDANSAIGPCHAGVLWQSAVYLDMF